MCPDLVTRAFSRMKARWSRSSGTSSVNIACRPVMGIRHGTKTLRPFGRRESVLASLIPDQDAGERNGLAQGPCAVT
jgi:hypothetical protein